MRSSQFSVDYTILEMRLTYNHNKTRVLQIRDPRYGAFWPLDPGEVFSGSWISKPGSQPYFWELNNDFLGKKVPYFLLNWLFLYLFKPKKIFSPSSFGLAVGWIRDPRSGVDKN
jgi:hypothetical protein